MIFTEELAGRCLFAIPKKGRLYDRCLELLNKIDIKFVRKNRLDIALCQNMNLALIFLPAADIALYVAQGNIDIGITGQDIVAESNVHIQELLLLDFGLCRLCVQAPIKDKIMEPKVLIGKRIVTSFPHLTEKYFKKLNPLVTTSVKHITGSVEVACTLGLADAVVDLVESGETMRAAGLEIVDVIMKTQAVLIANPHSPFKDLTEKIKKRIVGVLTAEKYMMIEYNIMRTKLQLAVQITPGSTSPTISPLEEDGWVAVKSMILRSESNDKMDQLQDIGAQAILLTNIPNCRV